MFTRFLRKLDVFKKRFAGHCSSGGGMGGPAGHCS